MIEKVLIIMDPIESINIKKDTTYQLILSAQEIGHEVYYLIPGSLAVKNLKPKAQIGKLKINKDTSPFFEISDIEELNLDTFNYILMRKDPPVDNNYIYMTYILDLIDKKNTKVINSGFALRNQNEKLITLNFPKHIPESIITSKKEDVEEFKKIHKKIILKPLNLMGGHSIYLIGEKDKNFNVILEDLTNRGRNYIIAQKYIDEATNGDKRIIIINGEVIKEAVIRKPNFEDHRSNLASGGTIEKYILNSDEVKICNEIAFFLKKEDIFFAGVDMIGDKITEVNITSPTCIAEINKFHNVDLGKKFWNKIK